MEVEPKDSAQYPAFCPVEFFDLAICCCANEVCSVIDEWSDEYLVGV